MAGCPCQVVEGLAVLWHFNQPTNKLKLKIEPQRNIKFQHIKSQFSTSSLACTNVQCQQFFWLVGVELGGMGVGVWISFWQQCHSVKVWKWQLWNNDCSSFSSESRLRVLSVCPQSHSPVHCQWSQAKLCLLITSQIRALALLSCPQSRLNCAR